MVINFAMTVFVNFTDNDLDRALIASVTIPLRMCADEQNDDAHKTKILAWADRVYPLLQPPNRLVNMLQSTGGRLRRPAGNVFWSRLQNRHSDKVGLIVDQFGDIDLFEKTLNHIVIQDLAAGPP